jgi:hypothetical protein
MNIFVIVIVGISIFTVMIFGFFMTEDPLIQFSKPENYEIQITGMKDVYLVGEPYSFSYVISGYGYSCGEKKVYFPDQNGDTMTEISSSSCIANTPMSDFVFDIQKKMGTTYGHTGIKNPGNYIVAVEFERGGMEPTQGGHGFHVVEKICDEQDPKDKAQCFVNAFDSCTPAFVELAYPTAEGDGIFVTGVVESWYDCNLRVYTDHTQDRYKGHSDGTRSICDGIVLDDESIIFENCNNEDIPPLRFDQQFYLHKEKCEIYGGWWDFEFNTCLDFSDDYDCENMGGELVERAYTGEQPDYSKNSHSFVCKFRK